MPSKRVRPQPAGPKCPKCGSQNTLPCEIDDRDTECQKCRCRFCK